jgi:hypothetical protein
MSNLTFTCLQNVENEEKNVEPFDWHCLSLIDGANCSPNRADILSHP